MNRIERAPDLEDTLLHAIRAERADIWTALPGVIQSFDPLKQTAVVQIAVLIPLRSPVTGLIEWVSIPPLLDCPVQFPRGGNCLLTFPVAKDDECLVVFATRCIDAWWQSGGYKNQLPLERFHSLSDGFVQLGFSSLPRVPSTISTTEVQLRSVDGGAVIALNPTTHDISTTTSGAATVTASAATINAATINLNGAVRINGQLYSAHRHSGVTVGGANSGAVI
jgi:hypothetical protein